MQMTVTANSAGAKKNVEDFQLATRIAENREEEEDVADKLKRWLPPRPPIASTP